MSLIPQFSYSQSEKLIHGKAVNEKFSVEGVGLVNAHNNEVTKTGLNGEFAIKAKPGDTLIFVSANYYRKVALKQVDIDNPNFTVQLVQKTVNLDEVVVAKQKEFNSQQIVDMQFTPDQNTSIKNAAVYDGVITNGVDLMRVGKEVGKLIKGKKQPEKPKIQFTTFVNTHLDNNFFLKNLKLKPEETALFMEYCKADPKSQEVVQSNDVLKVMDYMTGKNVTFRNALK